MVHAPTYPAYLTTEERTTIGMFDELVDKKRLRGRLSPDEESMKQSLQQEVKLLRERMRKAADLN